MYKITILNDIQYSETCVFIKLSSSGYYIETTVENAEGICVKIPKEYTIEKEDGSTETVTSLSDTVYRLTQNGLNGTETLITSLEIVPAQEAIDAAVDGVLDELEAAISG